jgi:hypothetical protein
VVRWLHPPWVMAEIRAIAENGGAMTNVLLSWRDGAAKQAIVDFLAQADSVPVEHRIAVFDNDGTLWCEKPMPIQLDFILRRFVEMAEASPELRERRRGRRRTSATTAGSARSCKSTMRATTPM